MTLGNFVTEAANILAYSVVRGMCDGTSSLPLLHLTGAPGRGKTHLLRAAAAAMGPRALYVSACTAAPEGVRRLDAPTCLAALMVDDMTLLRPPLAAAVSRAICALTEMGRPVLLAGSVGGAHPLLTDEAASRVIAGLRVDLPALGPVACARLVDRWCADMPEAAGLTFGEDVRAYVLQRCLPNGRAIIQALAALAALARLRAEPVSLALAAEALPMDVAAPRVMVSHVITVICRHFSISRADLFSQRRRADYVWARHVGVCLSKRLTSRSLPEIGRAFGGRDHTTILHACRRIEAIAAADPAVEALLGDLARTVTEEAAK